MTLTKKNFIAIAEILASQRVKYQGSSDPENDEIEYYQRTVVNELSKRLSKYFSRENANYDSQLFFDHITKVENELLDKEE